MSAASKFPDELQKEIAHMYHGAKNAPYLSYLAPVLRKLATKATRDFNKENDAFRDCEEAYLIAQIALVSDRGPLFLNSANAAVEFGRVATTCRMAETENVSWSVNVDLPALLKAHQPHRVRRVGLAAFPADVSDAPNLTDAQKFAGSVDYVFPIKNITATPFDKNAAYRNGLWSSPSGISRQTVHEMDPRQLVCVGDQTMFLDTRNGGKAVVMPGRPTMNDLYHTCFHDKLKAVMEQRTGDVSTILRSKEPAEKSELNDAMKARKQQIEKQITKKKSALKDEDNTSTMFALIADIQKLELDLKEHERLDAARLEAEEQSRRAKEAAGQTPSSCGGSCLGNAYHDCRGLVCGVGPDEAYDGSARKNVDSADGSDAVKGTGVCSYRPRYSARLLHEWAAKFIQVQTVWTDAMEKLQDNEDLRLTYQKYFWDWLDGVWVRFWHANSMVEAEPLVSVGSPSGSAMQWSYNFANADGGYSAVPSTDHAVTVENHFFLDTTFAMHEFQEKRTGPYEDASRELQKQQNRAAEQDVVSAKEKGLASDFSSREINIVRLADHALTPEGNVLLCNMERMLQTCLSTGKDAGVVYNYIRWTCCWRANARHKDSHGVHEDVQRVVFGLITRLEEYANRLKTYEGALSEDEFGLDYQKLALEVEHYTMALRAAHEMAEAMYTAMKNDGEWDAQTMLVDEMSEWLFDLDTLLRFTVDPSTPDHKDRLTRTSDVLERHARHEDALATYLTRRVVRYLEFGQDNEALRHLRDVMAMPQHRGAEECAFTCRNYGVDQRGNPYPACDACIPATPHDEFEAEMDYVFRLFALREALGDSLDALSVMNKHFDPLPETTETEKAEEKEIEEAIETAEKQVEELVHKEHEHKPSAKLEEEDAVKDSAQQRAIRSEIARLMMKQAIKVRDDRRKRQEAENARETQDTRRDAYQAAGNKEDVRGADWETVKQHKEVPLIQEMTFNIVTSNEPGENEELKLEVETAKLDYISFTLNVPRVVILLEHWKKASNSPLLWTTTEASNFWLVVSEDKLQAAHRHVRSKRRMDREDEYGDGSVKKSHSDLDVWMSPQTPAGYTHSFVRVLPVRYVDSVSQQMVRRFIKVFRRAQPGFRATRQEYDAWHAYMVQRGHLPARRPHDPRPPPSS